MLRLLTKWWHDRNHGHADYINAEMRIHACLPRWKMAKQAIIFIVPADPHLFPMAVTGTGLTCFRFINSLMENNEPLTIIGVTQRVLDDTTPGNEDIFINNVLMSHRVLGGNA